MYVLQLCVTSCPYNAIDFKNEFEDAVFNRQKLILRLDPVLPAQPQAAAPEPAATPEAPAAAPTEEKQPENN